MHILMTARASHACAHALVAAHLQVQGLLMESQERITGLEAALRDGQDAHAAVQQEVATAAELLAAVQAAREASQQKAKELKAEVKELTVKASSAREAAAAAQLAREEADAQALALEKRYQQLQVRG